jgi:mono/diheme cytochrome c family protein
MNTKSFFFASIAALVFAGCANTPPIEPNADSNGSGSTTPPDECLRDGKPCVAPPTSVPTSPELVAAVSVIFRQVCADCHGKGEARGNLPDIFDVDALKRKGLIRDKADNSPLFVKVDTDEMPAAGGFNPRTREQVKPLGKEQKQAIREWIDAGAPALRGDRTRISLDDYTRLLRRDQSALPRPEQEDLVYIDFHAVYNNPRHSNAEVSAFANATLKLLNGLDPRATQVQGVGGGAAVIVDSQQVPIAIRFNPARFNLNQIDIDRIIALTNRQDANEPFDCDVPAIPVLDFLQIASADDFFNPIKETFESGYSNIMLRRLFQDKNIINPNDNDTLIFNPIAKADFFAGNGVGFSNTSNFTLFDVLAARGVDLNDLDILFNQGNDNERLVRGCLLNSDVSAANRCIDRFALSDLRSGSFYVSWDTLSIGSAKDNADFFAANFVGPANPPGNPLVRQPGAFVVDGGEAIFQLPNRMQGYIVYNGNLQLVTNPPTFAVLNSSDSERGNFISARACSSCHASYTIKFKDAALNVAFKGINGATNEEAGFLFKIVQQQSDWDFTFADDKARYLEELRKVYVTTAESGALPDGIYSLGSHYLSDLQNEDIVAELGLLDIGELEDAVDNDTNLTAELRSIFGGGMSRENFTVNYQNLVRNVSSGNADFLRGCVSRVVSEPGDFGQGGEEGGN